MRYTTPTAANARYLAMPPAGLWLLRIEAGLHAVLVRLGAEGDFRAVFLKALDSPYLPMPGPGFE
jgi:hypothetical protein